MKAIVTLLVMGLSVNVLAQPKSTTSSKSISGKSESAQGDNSMLTLQPRASRVLVLAGGYYDTYTLRTKTNRNGVISESESKNEEKLFNLGLKYGLSDSLALAFAISTGKEEYTGTGQGSSGMPSVYQSENSGISSPSVWAEHKGDLTSGTSLFSKLGVIVPIGDHKCNSSESRRSSSGINVQECDRSEGGFVGLLKTGIENRGSIYTGISVEAKLRDRKSEKYTSSSGTQIDYYFVGGNHYTATAYVENPGTIFKVGGALAYQHWAPGNYSSSQGSNNPGTYMDFAQGSLYTDMKLSKDVSFFPQLSYTRLLRTSVNDQNYEGQNWVTASISAIIGI